MNQNGKLLQCVEKTGAIIAVKAKKLSPARIFKPVGLDSSRGHDLMELL